MSWVLPGRPDSAMNLLGIARWEGPQFQAPDLELDSELSGQLGRSVGDGDDHSRPMPIATRIGDGAD